MYNDKHGCLSIIWALCVCAGWCSQFVHWHRSSFSIVSLRLSTEDFGVNFLGTNVQNAFNLAQDPCFYFNQVRLVNTHIS